MKYHINMLFASALFAFCGISAAKNVDISPKLPLPTQTIPSHQHKVANFNYQTISHVLWPIVNKYTAYQDIPAWYANQHPMPMPGDTDVPVRLLTLRDAIWLVLRNNPDVKNAEVQRILDKYALEVARWQFHPHINQVEFTGTRNLENGAWDYKTSVNSQLQTALGTSFSAGYSNPTGGIFNNKNQYTATVTQPLLQGIFQPQLNYLTALANAKIEKLSFRDSIGQQVQAVIQDYMQLVQAYNDFHLQQVQLAQNKRQLDQDALRVKVGKMPRSELLREKVNYTQDRLNIVQNSNTLKTNYQTLLAQLGLVSTAKITIDQDIDTHGFAIPDEQTCINIMLQHNTQYLSDKIAIENAKRELRENKQQLWPTLNVTAGETLQKGVRPEPSVGFDISVPIDAKDKMQTVLQSRVDLEKAKLTLQHDHAQLVQQVITQWNTVQSDQQRITLAKEQIAMQKQTLSDSKLRLKYGRISMFEFISTQQDLLNQQIALIGSQISLINDVTQLDAVMGVMLKRWNIKLRY